MKYEQIVLEVRIVIGNWVRPGVTFATDTRGMSGIQVETGFLFFWLSWRGGL